MSVMHKIKEVCVCTIDLKPCNVDKHCLKCKKFKEYQKTEDVKKWKWRF